MILRELGRTCENKEEFSEDEVDSGRNRKNWRE